MSGPVVSIDAVPTPALVYDEGILRQELETARQICTLAGCRLLFSIKACYVPRVVEIVGEVVDGYSTTTLFETRLAAELKSAHHLIHVTAPLVHADEVDEISRLAQQITFNSLNQWTRLEAMIDPGVSLGMRVNPRLSMGIDVRYDPCRPNSQFGIPIEELHAAFEDDPALRSRISGLHFHNNCESSNLGELAATLDHVAAELPEMLARMRWLNIGGGYLLHDAVGLPSFAAAARELTRTFGVELYFEPGASLVGRSGVLLGTVLDIIESDGVALAMLDTTVHHVADILDFDYSPRIRESTAAGPYRYVVAGKSCLAGDRFGEYSFDEPLTPGTRLTIDDVGAYALSKATMFNGINLPSVWLAQGGVARNLASFDYADFRRLAGFPR